MNKQKLLAVLDMSEDSPEQYGWLLSTIREHKACCPANLAFRLRDEVCKNNHADFHEAIYDIMIKVEGDDKWATAFWGECIAKPIHWIIACLIAKGKE